MSGSANHNPVILSANLLDDIAYASPSIDTNGKVVVTVGLGIDVSIVLSSCKDQHTLERTGTVTFTGVMEDGVTVYNAWWISRADQNGNYIFTRSPTGQSTNNGNLSYTFNITKIERYTSNAFEIWFTYDGESAYVTLRAIDIRPPQKNDSFWG